MNWMRPVGTGRVALGRAAVGVVALIGVAGCYVPAPSRHATLRIAAAGSYELNGVPTSAADLQAKVGEAKPARGDLVVQIEAAPTGDVEAVRIAVAAVRAAHARVAFAREVSGG